MNLFLIVFCLLNLLFGGSTYVIDDSVGLAKTFDGIGGLSGGGATSKLLVNYPEPQRSQILDYLFKPNFAASFHILKVEIGGNAMSGDGTEASHMRESWDENYQRGYEWWIMKEAKKRNPSIKLSGLSWAYPAWVGNGTNNPYKYPNLTATYITKWILGAKRYHDLTIDYIGDLYLNKQEYTKYAHHNNGKEQIWNERPYNVTYVKTLRRTLNSNGLQDVKIVVADSGWFVAKDILKDPEFAQAVEVIGAHYPGTVTTKEALSTGKTLWASEDYSTFNNNVGAGCWARLLNQNYVNGYMTSTISWNLIASYYVNLPFGRDGLMTAMEPWSGHYVVESPIWITAHTTQFTQIGWKYLQHGAGVGKLEHGGSYVTLLGPDKSRTQFTMVIETATHDHSVCIRPSLPAYNVTSQTANFQLKGHLVNITSLNVWYSKLGFGTNNSTLMKSLPSIQVKDGKFSLHLDLDEVYTLTTLSTGQKGEYPTPPPSKSFPLPYKDDFEAYPEFSEPFNFVPQAGSWESRMSNDVEHGKVSRQAVLHHPIDWVLSQPPINIGGNYNWSDIMVQFDVLVPSVNGTDGVIAAVHVDRGGGDIIIAKGIYFRVFLDGHFVLSADLAMSQQLVQGPLPGKFSTDKWYHISLIVKGNRAYGFFNLQQVFMTMIRLTPGKGFVGYGTNSFGLADFDNLVVEDTSTLQDGY